MWRLSTETEDHEIVTMSLALYREDPSDQMVTETGVRRTLQELRLNPTRGRAVVFTHENQIAGYALLISFWSNEYSGEICFIDELYFKPPYRGQRFGSSLTQSILNDRKLWPTLPVLIELEVTPSNTRARELYSKMGFKAKKNAHMLFKTS